MDHTAPASISAWELMEPIGQPIARHEAAFVEMGGKFYLLGGRRMNPVSVYDPVTNAWKNGSVPPVEIHHFQPVIYGDRIVMVGVMTGPFPNETAVDRVLEYYPQTDRWTWGHAIPEERRRGGAGAVLADNGKIYVVGGIVNGHVGGYVNWMDEYDPVTGEWRVLPDAPHQRDHFQAVALDGKIYAVGGRHTSGETGQYFELVVPEMDIFDRATQSWSVAKEPLPTPRAGCFAMAHRRDVIVLGGESIVHVRAHDEVEAFDTINENWRALSPMQIGRHGSGAFIFDNYIYTCSGCAFRGGWPEMTHMERIAAEQFA
jgi:hypothetical protein